MSSYFRFLALVLVGVVAAAPSLAATEVEFTFDDEDDGAGVADGHAALDNMETDTENPGAGSVAAELVGTASRTGIDEGRYGRALDLDGGGEIAMEPWDSSRSRVFYLWMLVRDRNVGTLYSHEGSFDVFLDSGEVVLGAHRGPGDYVIFPTGALWPDDGAWHHLTVQMDLSGATPMVTVLVDLDAQPEIDIGFVPMSSDAPLRVGTALDGLIDELLIRNESDTDENVHFDRDPAFCPGTTSCVEEVIHMQPDAFGRVVPVRFKTVYDAARCTASTPCPLLVDISGGNKCPDDYDKAEAVAELADSGFVVLAVDLYCEGDDDTFPYQVETSQMIAAKNYVLASGAERGRISDDPYVASGCSHGALSVAQWQMREDDHPARTFSRSSGVAGLCDFFADEACPAIIEAGLDSLGLSSLDEVDMNGDDALIAAHQRNDLVALIDPELTATREVARSWGVNLDGDVCAANGNYLCHEEGLYGVTYGSRRYADVWEANQPAKAPTGYFVEDHSRDCQHCALPSSDAFACGVCLLQHGRQGMESACRWCLEYDGTIERGAPGDLCPIDADWYEDPLAQDPAPETDEAESGCCGGEGSKAAAWWLAPLALLTYRRRRPNREADPKVDN